MKFTEYSIQLTVPVSDVLTHQEIKNCANIHYLSLYRIVKENNNDTFWSCTITTTSLEQVFLFGKNIGQQIESKK